MKKPEINTFKRSRSDLIAAIFEELSGISGVKEKDLGNNPTREIIKLVACALEGKMRRPWMTHEEALSILGKRGAKLAKFKAAAEKARRIEILCVEFNNAFH